MSELLVKCLVFLLLLAGGVQAQDEGPVVPCSYCQNKGFKPCKKHKRSTLELEQDGVCEFCSDFAECSQCGGVAERDCVHCTNPSVEARHEHERKRIAAWLETRRKKVDALVQHRVLHGSSKNFDLVFDLKPMKVGKVVFSTHRLMHLYLERLEDLRALFRKTLQLGRGEIPIRHQIFIWRDGRDQSLAAPKFAGLGSHGVGVKLLGSGSVYTMLFDKSKIRGDKGLHRNVVHNVTHLLLSNAVPMQWIGQLKGGWVDAGLAHYFEYLLDERCTNYCYQEVATNLSFKGGKWLVPIRRKVSGDGELPSFASVSGKNTDQLDPLEHALSFSWVHFLFEGDFAESGKGKKFTRLTRVLKKKRPTRDALKAVYGWTSFAFEEKWKAWVVKTYPTR
ncbi:MAG: hypothetical protein ACE5F1_10020 [Planctomycetota bacterium]